MAYEDLYRSQQARLTADAAARAKGEKYSSKKGYMSPISAIWARQQDAAPPAGMGQFGAGETIYGDSKPATAQGFGGYYNTSVNAPKTAEVPKDAAYYMNLATQQLPGIDFSGLQSRAQTSVADTDARVKAMYKAMRDIQAQEAATRDASRTAAGESIATSATQAATDIQQGYDNAISSLANEMAALGIGETLAQEPAQRVTADSGRQQAIATQLGQISGNLNTGMGQADSAFNQQIRDVTGLEGVDFRSQLQSDLLNQLAQLDMAQQQQNQQLPMQRMNYAQGLRGYDQSFEPQQMSVADTLATQKFSQSQNQADRQFQMDVYNMFLQQTKDPAQASTLTTQYLQQQGLLPATG